MLKIGVLHGDDIGLEVVPEAFKVMAAAAKKTGLGLEWQRAGAIAGVNLKTIKLGGIVALMRAAAVSDTLGLAIDVACKTGESSIGAAALAHVGYAVPNLDWGININNHYLATDLVRRPVHQINGSVECPTGPGLGVEVDEAALRRFRVKSK